MKSFWKRGVKRQCKFYLECIQSENNDDLSRAETTSNWRKRKELGGFKIRLGWFGVAAMVVVSWKASV